MGKPNSNATEPDKWDSTPSTLMPTGMGATNPKFSKGGRKPKKTKHCTIPQNL